MSEAFSIKTRAANLARLAEETFDFLIIGGGITGASTARDAARRGFKVALVEKHDFAFGTSSRSSKLIHGGLRYLENYEFKLVFEALTERTLLLKTAPHLVKPIPFFMPIYKTGKSKWLLTMGLWLYDLLALFRSPGFHKWLNRRKTLVNYPHLNPDGLLGGFSYYDASMCDDLLVIETLRACQTAHVAAANYVEATKPNWQNDRIAGFWVKDRENPQSPEICVRAHQVIICAGPWTDMVGKLTQTSWKNWLTPSKGVHLLFDLKKIPVQETVVMNDPLDGRISFIIPRSDYGDGIAIVGTTDGPAPEDPSLVTVEKSDVDYLMNLLHRYFPTLPLERTDIISAYVGVRPLFGNIGHQAEESSKSLQKVSREHHIGTGPGGTVVVAGGKYTTHRPMAREVVDFSISEWEKAHELAMTPKVPGHHASDTKEPINPLGMLSATLNAKAKAVQKGWTIPEKLWERYGAEALKVFTLHIEKGDAGLGDIPGFPCLAAQLRWAIRTGMTIHLKDFYFRRSSLYASRADHGLPFAEKLAQVFAEEAEIAPAQISQEIKSLRQEVETTTAWQKIT